MRTWQKNVRDSLELLRKRIEDKGIPTNVVTEAIKNNPWFTPYFIHSAMKAITPWLDGKSLDPFIQTYEYEYSPKKVGIIMAGNIPWVGMHDLILGILSGHDIIIKPSRQDRVLWDWFLMEWRGMFPLLFHKLKVSESIPTSIDLLIATGSDNTARYFEFAYKDTSRVIRKNRYSIALVNRSTTEGEWNALAKDVFLYNGLGCRSVNNLLIEQGTDLSVWLDICKQYHAEYLSDWYMQKVAIERARLSMLGEKFINADKLLILTGQELRNVSMGYLNCVFYQEEEKLDQYLHPLLSDIQCIVGKGTKFGKTQYPKINSFSDNVDTMKILTTLTMGK